jgi:hypothetical protein
MYFIVPWAAIGMDHAENTIPLLVYTGCCIVMDSCCDSTFIVWVNMPTAASLRLLVPSSLQAYNHFFFPEGCNCDVCDRHRLPSPWRGSQGDYSPTVPAAPSLRPLVPSGSLIRYQPVQLYHHHLSTKVRSILYTTTFIWMTTLYGPTNKNWRWDNFHFVGVGW